MGAPLVIEGRSFQKNKVSMIKSAKYVVMALALLVVASCSDKKKPEAKLPVDPRMDQQMLRTSKDTTMLLDMTKKFLETLKKNDIDGAISQLYEVKDNKVMPLSAEREKELRKNFANFPVLSYQIDELLLYSDSDTEVRYTIEFFEKPKGDKRPNTIKCSVNPTRVGGNWYLTIAKVTQENNYKND